MNNEITNEILLELFNDLQLWQSAQNAILKFLWEHHANHEAVKNGTDFAETVSHQASQIIDNLPKTMTSSNRHEVEARIRVLSMDIIKPHK